jgi:hypothetical protein
LQEADLYRTIEPWEFFGLQWTQNNKKGLIYITDSEVDCWSAVREETKSVNILSFINRFNQVGNWVTSEILACQDMKKRAQIIGHFIKVAEVSTLLIFCPHGSQACRQDLKNFNGCMEIAAGLSSSSVQRLKGTWSLVPAKKMHLFNELNALMDGNFKILRYFRSVMPKVNLMTEIS